MKSLFITTWIIFLAVVLYVTQPEHKCVNRDTLLDPWSVEMIEKYDKDCRR